MKYHMLENLETQDRELLEYSTKFFNLLVCQNREVQQWIFFQFYIASAHFSFSTAELTNTILYAYFPLFMVRTKSSRCALRNMTD